MSEMDGEIMSGIYDFNVAITCLTRAIEEAIEELRESGGLKESIHDLIDAIEGMGGNAYDVDAHKLIEAYTRCQDEIKEHEDFKMVEESIPLTNKSYEATLLGGLMLDSSKIDDILKICGVRENSFEDQKNKNIFMAIKRLHKKNESIDTLSIAEEVGCVGCIKDESYLFNLAKETSGKVLPHLKSIANVVVMDAYKRKKK